MGNIFAIIQLVSELFTVYQTAQQDGTVPEVQTAVSALMAEFAKPATVEAVAHAKALFKVSA
jgi:hypothetical protein